MAPDGTRQWTYYVTPLVRNQWPEKTGEQFVAEQMAASDFCSGGYAIESVITEGDMTVYAGGCL